MLTLVLIKMCTATEDEQAWKQLCPKRSSLKGRNPNIRYFVARFWKRFCGTFNKSHPASESFQQKSACFRRALQPKTYAIVNTIFCKFALSERAEGCMWLYPTSYLTCTDSRFNLCANLCILFQNSWILPIVVDFEVCARISRCCGREDGQFWSHSCLYTIRILSQYIFENEG